MENFSDIGKYLRIPCHQITIPEGQEKSHPVAIAAIAEILKSKGSNFLPLMVEEVDEEQYEVIYNAHLLEAAQQAKLDFVWCIIADAEARQQIEVETKQRLQIGLLKASEATIAGMLEYIQTVDPSFRRINAAKAAKAIVKNRQPNWINFQPLTKLRCQIGAKKLDVLRNYFYLG
jgi:hypothetical protein